MRLLFTLGLLLPAMVHAAPASKALEAFLSGVQSYSARFEQIQRDETGEELQTTSGRMALQRPGKFNWIYEKPYSQIMVCDGKDIWLYDPDLKQVTVRPAKEALAGTPAELLSQRASIKTQFKIKDAGLDNGSHLVRLVPKAADSDFQSIELWLKQGAPQRMRFHDQLGNVTEIRFSDIQTNTALDAAQFAFAPPPDVEVIGRDAEPSENSASDD